jgi:hypothetical protein
MSLKKIAVTGIENKVKFSEDTLVIQIVFGGLGDHLFYSHLPRIAKETNAYKTVLVSNKSDFRNKLYKEYIWKQNPFVDGFTDEAGWYPEVSEELDGYNLLDTIMFGYGLDDDQKWHEPEFYANVPIKHELKDKIIYDPNYISNAGKMGLKKLRQYFKQNKIQVDYQMQLREDFKSFQLLDIKALAAQSFIDYCSIIKSCKKFYCLTSGGATLASALKSNAIVLHGAGIKSKFHHSKMNEYVLIEPDAKNFKRMAIGKLKRLLGIL